MGHYLEANMETRWQALEEREERISQPRMLFRRIVKPQ